MFDPGFLPLRDDTVRHGAKDGNTNEHANTGGKEGGAASTLIETVIHGEDEREGGEEQVENTVGDGNVERHESNDGG